MSIRFDASADQLSYSGVPGTQWSVGFRFQIVTDRNDYSSLYCIDNGSSDYLAIETGSDGTTVALFTDFDGGTQHDLFAATVGSWYYFGYTYEAAGNHVVRPFSRALTSATFTTHTTYTAGALGTVTQRIASNGFGEWGNIRVEGFRIWDAELTANEHLLESYFNTPRRTTNLIHWIPGRGSSTNLKGSAWTVGGTLTYEEDSPAVIMGVANMPRPYVSAAAAAVTEAEMMAAISGAMRVGDASYADRLVRVLSSGQGGVKR